MKKHSSLFQSKTLKNEKNLFFYQTIEKEVFVFKDMVSNGIWSRKGRMFFICWRCS